MLDVEIHNFQSIEHTHVRIEGFTALVGRSNLGKSAIVRAVKAALTGAAEDNFVRHGATCEREVKGTKSCKCYCTVHLRAEGFDLLWEKGGDRNEYVFNGQKYSAMGKGTPTFLDEGFGLVKIGDNKILLQVADQFRSEGGGPIFLLDESGQVIADVLSDVAQLDRINVASRMAEKDRRDAVAQRKVREKDVLELKIKTASYEGLDGVLTRVREVEVGERRIEEQRALRDKIKRLKESMITVGAQFKALRGISTIAIPEWDIVSAQHRRAKVILDYISATGARQTVIEKLEGVDTIEVPAIEPVHKARTSHQKLHAWVTKLRTYKDLFARWKAAEAVPIPAIDGMGTAAKQTLKLRNLHGRYVALGQGVEKLEQLMVAVEAEYQAVRDEEADLGVCPTCARPVDLTHEHAAE